MTDDEALETLFAMANVQDGYAKKATDRGLKVIHKANAKAQREVAATIKDLRARLASAEADRDRLAAANAALEAQVARLEGALTPFAFFDDEGGDTQHAWEIRYRDRFQDWIDFADIEEARAALAEVQADARREGGE